MTRKKQEAEPGPSNRTRMARKRRKPHNAINSSDYLSLAELLQKVGSETRKVPVGGELMEMSRAERTLRRIVGRALAGEPREVAQVLRHMLKYPELSKSVREELVIRINGSDCLA